MSVNILDQNGNLKKIAHGFSESKFNTFRSDVISNIEMTDTASKDYAVGDFLIMANGQLAQVTSVIYQDMTINLSNVRLTTVEEMIAVKADSADIPDVSKYQKIFTGTTAEWNQLTTEQKTAYDLANITDDLGTEADIVDAVSDGDMRAVTSNAVHDALESKISTSETVGLVKNDGSIDTKSYAEKVANGTENNLAGLDANGNLADGGWSSDKTTTSATGNPISISGLKSNQLAINPVITFEPIQAGSGTPSPSNVRAISGYDKIEVLSCGKNIFDLDANYITRDGYPGTYTKANNGITVKSTGSGNAYCGFLIRVEIGKDYVITYSSSTTEYVRIYQSDIPISTIINEYGTTMSSGTTIRATKSYFLVNLAGNTTGSTYTNIQLEEDNQATTYEPCNKTTDLSESLGQTVYGGTLDLRSGKLMVTKGIIDLGTLAWVYDTTNLQFYSEIIYGVKTSGWTYNVLCSKYSVDAGMEQTPHLRGINGTSNSGRVYIIDPNYNDGTAFKTSLNGVQLVYELATPFTIQLTPHEISILKDYAYVSTNGTSISLDYHNGELASLAEVSQLGETVNNLGEYVEKNDAGSVIDISSYTSTNKYVCPCDGYVQLYSGSASSGYMRVVINGANDEVMTYLYMNITVAFTSNAVFVKKGMKVYVNENTVTASSMAITFNPIK